MKEIDVQGHRGCRGLMPENSIPGFLKALELGVTTLELDVVITQDSKVVVSHEPFLSHEICSDTTGNRIQEADAQSFNIYNLTYNQLQQFDCGLQHHPRFPEQQKLPTTKPLLTDVIKAAETYCLHNGRPLPYYNIETKCTPQGDGVFHPGPERFTRLLLDVVASTNIKERFILQSFDVRTLRYAKQIDTTFITALLVENQDGIEANLAMLGFTPSIYSCDYTLLQPGEVETLQNRGMLVIPWTVNDPKDMEHLLEEGVDGIITDYPDRLLKIARAKS
jgi:glycerophosphoryl diester phosphodiesterase